MSAKIARAYFFDVFDTCVSRRYAYPKDLLFALGLELAGSGLSPDEKMVFAANFQQRRITAERQAYRLVNGREGASMLEIYQLFRPPSGLNIPNPEIMAAEIELEKASIYAIPEIKEEIESLRSQDKRIVFISDMYLPADILKRMLLNLDIMKANEKLFVSSDIGLTKSTGNLFRHALKVEGLQPDEVFHTGDNPRADIAAARSLGIATRHFSGAALTGHEQLTVDRISPYSFAGSEIAGLSRRSRLLSRHDKKMPAHDLDAIMSSVVAPLLISYVGWVIEQARHAGIKRLYFVARDGEIMYKIASRLISSDDGIEIRYLYGSRIAWLSASITGTSNEWTRSLAPQGQLCSMTSIMNRIGLNNEEKTAIFSILGTTAADADLPLDRVECSRFIAALSENDRIYRIVLNASAKARDLALEYFRQEGLLQNVKWALVDTGWSLNCQAALKRILSTRLGNDFKPLGFYMALAANRISETESGTAQGFVPDPGLVLFRRRTMVEHFFTPALHASTKGYTLHDGTVQPVLGDEVRNEREMTYVRRLHEICVIQAGLVASNPSLLQQIVSTSDKIIESAEHFILNPSRQDAAALQALSATADFFHEAAFIQPFCRPLGGGDLFRLLRMLFSGKVRREQRPFVWLEGCCALSPAYIRLPLSWMLRCKLFLLRVGLR